MLVFGGDSQDKGIGDIRFTKLLLDLKAQTGNEDRVEFIIGNRDANKLRLASELQDDCIDDSAVLNGMRNKNKRASQGGSEGTRARVNVSVYTDECHDAHMETRSPRNNPVSLSFQIPDIRSL